MKRKFQKREGWREKVDAHRKFVYDYLWSEREHAKKFRPPESHWQTVVGYHHIYLTAEDDPARVIISCDIYPDERFIVPEHILKKCLAKYSVPDLTQHLGHMICAECIKEGIIYHPVEELKYTIDFQI